MTQNINKISYFESKNFNPYINISTEMQLLDICEPDELIIYLWSNDKTVVIGRNQDAFSEVDVAALEADGGFLARRYSGGGAVYHDVNNLNFSFITSEKNYDKIKQTNVIVMAVEKYGIKAEISGRNDILADGRKFSGNAYLNRKNNSLHHGTILINTDLSKMQKYLNIKASKMDIKGIKSVKSRVINLIEICNAHKADLTLKIKQSAEEIYGIKTADFNEDRFDKKAIETEAEKLSGKAWLYGQIAPNMTKIRANYAWGGAEICYKTEGEKVTEFKVYSDTLETEKLSLAEVFIKGSKISELKPKDNEIFNDLISIFGGSI